MARTKKNDADAAIESVPYFGQHLRGVDNGRIILPQEWRSGGAPTTFTMLPWPIVAPEYVLVLPPARWELMQKKLQAVSLADERTARVERQIASSISQKTLDKYGRLPLSDAALKLLDIQSEAMLVGRMDKFEIWNPAKCSTVLSQPDAQLIADVLKTLQI